MNTLDFTARQAAGSVRVFRDVSRVWMFEQRRFNDETGVLVAPKVEPVDLASVRRDRDLYASMVADLNALLVACGQPI